MSLQHILTRALVAAAALILGSQAFAARTTTYYHNDGLGSVVAATNEAGAVLWRKDYAPFGEQIDTTPDTERQSYTGKSHDDVTGLTYFGGRYYDPQVARFMSVDPVAFVDDNTMSFNRYLYVNNNPYKYVDPDGEFLNFVAKFVLDVGINVAFNYVTTGELNVGGALKESALGVLNPAKTVAKAGKLAIAMKKADKVAPDPSTVKAAINAQKQAGHIPGTPQNINRLKQGKPTSIFFGKESGDKLTRIANEKGKAVPNRPNVKEHEFGISVGTGPNSGMQSKVRVHTSPKTGEIHGHPSGPERR